MPIVAAVCNRRPLRIEKDYKENALSYPVGRPRDQRVGIEVRWGSTLWLPCSLRGKFGTRCVGIAMVSGYSQGRTAAPAPPSPGAAPWAPAKTVVNISTGWVDASGLFHEVDTYSDVFDRSAALRSVAFLHPSPGVVPWVPASCLGGHYIVGGGCLVDSSEGMLVIRWERAACLSRRYCGARCLSSGLGRWQAGYGVWVFSRALRLCVRLSATAPSTGSGSACRPSLHRSLLFHTPSLGVAPLDPAREVGCAWKRWDGCLATC